MKGKNRAAKELPSVGIFPDPVGIWFSALGSLGKEPFFFHILSTNETTQPTQPTQPTLLKMTFEIKLEQWWQFKKDCCPLCNKCLKIESVSRHLRGDFCPSLLVLCPVRRLELSHFFNDLKFQFSGRKTVPHILSEKEKVASAICQILHFKYQPRLEWLCEMQDGSSSWISNSLLSTCRVGNKWIKRGQRSRKKGLVKEVLDSFSQVIRVEAPSIHQDQEEETFELAQSQSEEKEIQEEEKEIQEEEKEIQEEEIQEEEKEIQVEEKEQEGKEGKEEEEEEELLCISFPEQEWEVEKILSRKVYQGRIYYKVQWIGSSETTWEPFKNLIGCKELLAEFHKNEKVPMSAFQFEIVEKLSELNYLVNWVQIANSKTQIKQRKATICYVLTQLCQYKEVSIKELVSKQPLLSRLLCDLHFSHLIWKDYKKIHSNPSTLRNQCDFMRHLLSFLISSESQSAIIIQLNGIKTFWQTESRHWSSKANYFRRTKRTKSTLQASNQFLSEEEMKEVDEKAYIQLDSLIEKGSKLLFSFSFSLLPRFSNNRRN